MPHALRFVVEGMSDEGKPFRPSDWTERISGNLSSFGPDRRMRYSRYVQPQTIDGVKCLVIDPELREHNRAAFDFLMEFARGNRLRMHEPHDDHAAPLGET